MTIIDTKFLAENAKGKLMKYPVTMEIKDEQIWFLKSPFILKDEIKSMAGARWRGFDENPVKAWSVKDCPRNRFQIQWLEGGNPYEWFERPLQEFVPEGYERLGKPVWAHQRKLINSGLTYHYQILAACPGAGKTLAAFEIMERSGVKHWWFIAPKTVLLELAIQVKRWQLDPSIRVEFMTPEKAASVVKSGAYDLPQGLIIDEASKVKSATTSRSAAAQEVADRIREVYDKEGFVLTMSGTPSPKSPVDIWSIAEITWPGFLREGSPKALELRLGVFKTNPRPGDIGGFYNERVAWLCEDGQCKTCGLSKGEHDMLTMTDPEESHPYVKAENEVALLHQRLNGLMVTVHKHECTELPPKTYVRLRLEGSKKLLKVAAAIQRTAQTTSQGLAQLRQISDGFLYQDKQQGMKECPTCKGTGEVDEWFNPVEPDRPYASIELMDADKCANFEKRKTTCIHCMGSKEIPHMVKVATEVPCPKVEAVEDLLEKAEGCGRILLFAGFVGSVDRIVGICKAAGWDVWRCDGRGSVIFGNEGKQVCKANPLEYWKDMENPRVAFVANPESGGFGLTLTEAETAVFYSNSYKPEFRLQAEERLHRPGQTQPVKIYDLIHLPSDERALDILTANRELEKMVLGDILGDCFQ